MVPKLLHVHNCSLNSSNVSVHSLKVKKADMDIKRHRINTTVFAGGPLFLLSFNSFLPGSHISMSCRLQFSAGWITSNMWG